MEKSSEVKQKQVKNYKTKAQDRKNSSKIKFTIDK